MYCWLCVCTTTTTFFFEVPLPCEPQYYSLLSPGGKVGRFALPVSGACARLGGGRRLLLLAGSGGVCPRFRARGGLSCSL